MPSTREGSPTPPGSRHAQLSSDDDVGSAAYQLPRGVLSSSASVAVTSPPSGYGALSTPAKKFHAFNPDAAVLTSSPPAPNDPLVPLKKLETDLEHNYEIQKTARLQKVLCLYPGGVPAIEIERHKQKEDIERTKFVVYKESQMAKFVNGANGYYSGGAQNPYGDQVTPRQQDFSFGSPKTHLSFNNNHPTNTQNQFRVNQSFPPPPSRFRTGNSTFGSSACAYSHNMSSNSGAPDSAPSGATDGNDSLPSDTKIANTTADGTAPADKDHDYDRVIAAMQHMWNTIEQEHTENKQLRNEVTELKQLLTALTGGSDGLSHRVTVLEHKVLSVENSQPLESDAAFVANLEGEIATVREQLSVLANSSVTRRAFESEYGLMNQTFNSKFSLMEKSLGLDITTTGPKPHDLLDTLHMRIWNLECQLPADNPHCKRDIHYCNFQEFMKTTLNKNNAVVNFSNSPGFKSGAFSDTSFTHGGATANNRMSLDQFLGNTGPSSMAPIGTRRRPSDVSMLQNHLANMRFDPNDVRFNGFNGTQNNGRNISDHSMKNNSRNISEYSINSESGAVQPAGTETSRRSSGAGFLPDGMSGPHWRRGRGSRGSVGVASPGRKTAESAGEIGEAEGALRAATAGTVEQSSPEKSSRDKAYVGWMNQRPGDFIGKKLSGLGQNQ